MTWVLNTVRINILKIAELFDEIEKLTYPEIKEFLIKHVQGGEPIPYEKYFALAGVQYIPKEMIREFSLGGIGISRRFNRENNSEYDKVDE